MSKNRAFFAVASGLFALLVVPYVYYAMQANAAIHAHKHEFPSGVENYIFDVSDLYVSVLSALAIQLLKTTLVQVLRPVVKVVRRPKKDETKEMAEIENKIAIEHICKILFHGTVAVYSYMVF